MAERVEVVRVSRTDVEDVFLLERKHADGVEAVQIPACPRDKRRMDGRQYQFFYASINGDGRWKLGAYAPYQAW